MKVVLATLALAATATLATPALAGECVSDLIKARDQMAVASLDPYTGEQAHILISKAQSQKSDGEFEACKITTTELLALLEIA